MDAENIGPFWISDKTFLVINIFQKWAYLRIWCIAYGTNLVKSCFFQSTLHMDHTLQSKFFLFLDHLVGILLLLSLHCMWIIPYRILPLLFLYCIWVVPYRTIFLQFYIVCGWHLAAVFILLFLHWILPTRYKILLLPFWHCIWFPPSKHHFLMFTNCLWLSLYEILLLLILHGSGVYLERSLSCCFYIEWYS